MYIKNENRIGYKKTKVGWIPEEWEVDNVGSFACIETGAKDTKDRVENGKYPFFVRSQKSERIDTYSYEGTAVLTAGDGVGTGKVFHYVDGKFDYHQRVYKISDFSRFVFPRFFFEYFRLNFIRQVRRYSAKNSVDSVRMEMITNMLIPLPPLAEQKTIAEVLECWDKTIRKYEEKIEKKRNIKNGLIQKLLSGQIRLPGFTGEWRLIQVKKLFGTLTEKAIPSVAELLSVTQDRGVIPRSMLAGRVMSPEKGTSSYRLVRNGDFVISLRSFQGGLEFSAYDGLVSPAYTVLRPVITLNHLFYKYFFKSYLFIKKHLAKAVVGIRDGKQICVPMFLTVEIPVPCIEEQSAIATVLSEADLEIEVLERKLAILKDQKKFLLNNLVTGTIRLPQFRRGTKDSRTDGDKT